jgi:homocysteine S-methyltransferase
VDPRSSTTDPAPAPAGQPADALARLLHDRPVVILDGALASELERRGADLKDPLWSARCLIEQPRLIRDVHADYFAAGADIATTATYQASFEGFAGRGIGRDGAERLMRAAVTLAREARDEFWSDPANRRARPRPLVAASVGPYGAMLADGSEYRGRYAASDRELEEFHRERLEILCDAGADLLACETFPSLREALIVAALIEERAGPPAWISFSCRDGAHDCEGDDVGECAAALEGYERITAIGVNCSPPEYVAELLERMHGHSAKPLVAYPNSGGRYDPDAKCWAGAGSDTAFVERAKGWRRAGARLIGGCCGTSPEDIRRISRALAAESPPRVVD